MFYRKRFLIMGRYLYQAPETGSTYLRCAMCGRTFRVFKYRMREKAKFCSMPCCWAAQRAFMKALCDGRLDMLLADERERAKRARAEWRGAHEQ